MRVRFTRMLNPTLEVVEHSTVIAISIEYVYHHWTNVIVVGCIVVYVLVYAVVKITVKP